MIIFLAKPIAHGMSQSESKTTLGLCKEQAMISNIKNVVGLVNRTIKKTSAVSPTGKGNLYGFYRGIV
jgi:hypothetical protein